MTRRARNVSIAATLLGGALLLGGCEKNSASTFMEIEPRTEPIAVFDNLTMEGGDVRPYFFQISGDKIHPEVRANWTVINREVYIDMYVMRAEDYDPNLLPPEQPRIFWSSVPSEGPLFGDRRGSSIILHPCEYDNAPEPQCRPDGSWVVLFYSDNQRSQVNRTKVSATVYLRYFQ